MNIKNNIIIRLISCIYSMGFRLGVAWWRMQNFIINEPEIALKMADFLEEEVSLETDKARKNNLIQWARIFRGQHRELHSE